MPKHETLAAALAAFQAELPKLRKDETAKVKGESANGAPVNYTYGYADLAQVVEAVSMCLGRHGMAFTAFPTMTENGMFILAYSLLHEGGEERSGIWPLPDPMRVKAQALGSAITYARRYAQMAVTNTFPDKEDDDGAAAVAANHDEWGGAKPRQQAPAAAPVSAPPAPKVWTDADVAGLHAKLADRTVNLDTTGKGYDWMAANGLHERPVDGKTATAVLADRLATEALDSKTALAHVKAIQSFATARGLMKVKVSETETLANTLFEAQELAQHAADAEGSQDSPHPDPTGEQL